MPKDLPETAQLWQGVVKFFSIDTDLIQSASYNFDKGLLRQLPSQLPAAMSLQLTEIVVQEIIGHQMANVKKAAESLVSASNGLARYAGLNLEKVNLAVNELSINSHALDHYRNLINSYVETCRGDILSIEGEGLANSMFRLYFEGAAPFENKKEKKAEFPDACNLLLLENYARQNNAKGIIASGDKGVAQFASSSDYLYCVKSIEELAALFVATGEHAQKIKNRIIAEFSNKLSPVREHLEDELNRHIQDSSWAVGQIYSEAAYRVEADIYSKELNYYELNLKDSEIWESVDEDGFFIFEVMISAIVNIISEIGFYVYDYVDRDEVFLTQREHVTEKNIKIRSFIRISRASDENPPEDWDIEVDIGGYKYVVDIGDVYPNLEDEDYEE